MTTILIPDRLNAALGRLSASLGQLEAAVERRLETEAGRTDLQAEMMLLQEDRSRLALELDAALSRGRALISANDEVSLRLDKATETVKALLGRFDNLRVLAPEAENDFAEERPARRAGGRGE